jgi:hypothetical protein
MRQGSKVHLDFGRTGREIHRNEPGKVQVGMKRKAEGRIMKVQRASEIEEAELMLVLSA